MGGRCFFEICFLWDAVGSVNFQFFSSPSRLPCYVFCICMLTFCMVFNANQLNLAINNSSPRLTLLGPDSSGPSSVQQDRLCRTARFCSKTGPLLLLFTRFCSTTNVLLFFSFRSAPSEVRLSSARHALSRPSRWALHCLMGGK